MRLNHRRYRYRPKFTVGDALRISLMVGTCLGCSVGVSWAGPEGGVIAGGSARIAQVGNSTTIHQTSDRTLIDWQSFNVGSDESVRFYQPGSSSIAINRIHDANPSTILGSLSANGQIMLINPNGVVFGSGSQVDVGSLVISTASPTEQDAQSFIAGQTDKLNLSVAGNPNAQILNAGNITAKQAGLVGFVAPNVINNGVIIANKGTVQLASGDMATLDLYGDSLVDVAVSPEVQNQLIEQNGWVQADGGKVVISAAAGETIVNSVINMGGVTQAHSIEQKDGKIILTGDNSTINVTGKIDVSGKAANQRGGTLTATAKHINLKPTATIDASGDKGGGTIKIGGDYQGKGSLKTSGTVAMENRATIYNDAITSGDGGTTILWSDDHTYFAGSIFGRGGSQSGNGGFVETSGKANLTSSGSIDLRATSGNAGTWLIDPTNIIIYNRAQGGTDNVNSFTTAYLEAQNAHINLVADNHITFNLANDTLSLSNNYNLTLTATSGNISSASNGTITTSGTGNVTFIAGQDITFANDLDLTAGGTGSITLQANRNIAYTGSGDITTNGGAITLNSDRDATSGGAISLGSGTVITSGGGNITLGGGATPSSVNAIGIDATYVQGIGLSGASIDARGPSTTGGNIIMNGTGWSGLTTVGGLTSAHGIILDSNVTVQTNNSGTITMTGVGGGTGASGSNMGVFVRNGSSIIATNGLISLTGRGGTGSSGDNNGITVSSVGTNKIQSNGSGAINLFGTGGSGGPSNQGIIVNTTAGTAGIFSISGDITLTGLLNGSGFGLSGPTGSIIGGASATGKISLIANSLNPIFLPAIQTTGDVVIRPYTASTTVGIGSGSLNISDNLISGITYGGTLWLGGYGLTGVETGYWNSSGNLTLNTTRSFSKNVNFISGADILSGGASTITLTGTANSTLWASNDINISHDLDITASGSGSVTLQANRTILYSGEGDITTNGGAITLNSDRDQDNYGRIGITSDSRFLSNGGNIIFGGGLNPITGYAIAKSNSSGVNFLDNGIGTLSPILNAGGGNIIINGQGWNDAAATASRGVNIKGAQIITSGDGNITIRGIGGGTASTTTNNNHGVYLYHTGTDGQTSLIQTVNGTISLTGSSMEASATPSYALRIDTGLIQTIGTGNVYISTTNNGSALGNLISVSSSVISGGNITFSSDNLHSSGMTMTASGDITLRPYTYGTTVGIGAGAGTLQITNTALNKLTYGGTLWLGGYGLTGAEADYWNSSGNLTLNTTRSFAKNVNFISGADILSGGASTITLTGTASSTLWAINDINISHDLDITASGSGSVTERANRNIIYSASGDITTTGGAITLNSDRDAISGGAISLASGTAVISNGGNITLGGGPDPAGTAAIGTSTYLQGIILLNTNLDARGPGSTGGNITMNGTGWSGATISGNYTAHGILLETGTVQTNNSGTITMSGTGGGTGTAGNVIGVWLYNGSAVNAVNGLISITGRGGTGSNGSNQGLVLSTTGTNKIQSAGTGAITLFGTGGTGGSANNCISINSNSSGGVFSTTGNVTLTGLLTGTGYGLSGISGPVIGGPSATGLISIIGDTLNSTLLPTIQTTGDVVIRPYTTGTTVGIGSGSGALSITDAFLNNINYGSTLWLGGYGLTGSETGYWNSSGNLTLNTTRSFAKNVNFISGADILSGAASTITLTGTASSTLWAINDINISHDLDVTASGNGSVTLRTNNGIRYSGSGDITTNSGSITLNSNYDAINSGGIYLGTGTALSSGAGSIILGGGTSPLSTYATGSNTHGVRLAEASLSTSSGTISIRGSGTPTTGYGVYATNSNITTTSGNISLYGYGQNPTNSHGINLADSSITSIDGHISLYSIAIQGLGLVLWNNANLYTEHGNIYIESTAYNSDFYFNTTGTKTIGGSNATGNITLVFDDRHWNNTTVQTMGDVTLRPYTVGTTVGIGSGAGTLSIDDSVLNSITYGGTLWLGGYGLTGAETGYWNSSGNMTINTTRSFAKNVNFISGSNIINAGTNLTGTGTANILLKAANQITTTSTGGLTTATGNIELTATNGIALSHAFALTSTGGNINLNNNITSTVAQTFNAGGTLTANAITMGANDLTLTADDLVLNGNLSGTGTLTLQPYSTNRGVNVNYGTDDGSKFHLSTTEVSRFVNGWSLINIGRTNGTGYTTINNSNWTDPLSIRSSSNKSLFNVAMTDGATLTVTGDADIRGAITTNGGSFTASGGILGYGGSIATNGGDVITGTLTTWDAGNGITINTSGGNISITGSTTMGGTPTGSRSFALNAGTGTVSFGNTVNTNADITVTGSSLTFNGAWGGTSALGNVTLTSAGSISLPAITTLAGKTVNATVTGAGNSITASTIVTGTSGNISLTADDLILNSNLSGTDTLTLQPYAIDRLVRINSGTADGSNFNLSTTDLSRLTNGWSTLNIGRTNSTASMEVGGSSWADPVVFRSTYRMQLSNGLTGTDNASFSFNNGGYVNLFGNITTAGGSVAFENNLQADTGVITTNGGSIAVSGILKLTNGINPITLSSGGGAIVFTGGIGETSGGSTSSKLLTISADTGAITFGNAVNGIYNLTATAGSMTFNGVWGGTTALSNITLTSTSSISLPSITTAAGKTVSATVTGSGNSITASTIATDTSGNITLTADDLIINGNLSGTGTLTLQPYANNRLVYLNYGSADGSNLNLNTSELNRLVDGWGTINIGRVDAANTLEIGASTWTDPVVFRSSHRMQLRDDITATGNSSFTFGSNNTAWLNPRGKTVTTNGGLINVVGRLLYNNLGTSTFISNGGDVSFYDLGTQTGGNVNVNSANGNISITSNIFESGATSDVSTTLDAGTGTVTFGGTANGATSITVSGSTIIFNGNWGTTKSLSVVSLTAVNSLSLPSITASSVLARTTGGAADITIGSGRAITSSGSGGITLVAGRNFINQAGSGALVAGGSGRWLVYSTDVVGTTGEQDLAAGFNRYSCSYGAGCAAGVSVPSSGNGLVYSYTPTLTVTPTTKTVTYGDAVSGLNSYAYSIAGYLGADGSSDSITGSLNGATSYAAGNDVGTYALNYDSGSLASALGYGFSYANKSNGVDVTARVLTASLTGSVTKIYDGNANATLAVGNYTLSNVYNGDDVALGNITSGTYNDQNAGSGKSVSVSGLFLNGAKAGNYTLTSNSLSGNVGVVTPKGLTVSATTGQHKTYGQSDSALTYGYTGLVGGDVSASFTGALARAAGDNAGTYAINVGSLAATGNYTIGSFTGSDYTIDKASINVTAPTGSRYYGYDNPNYSWADATISGLQYGESGAVLDNLSFAIANSATASANAGTSHAVTLGGFSDNNYTLGSFTGGMLTIAKAPLTISADSLTRVVIMPTPTLTASFSGLRNGETAAVVSGMTLSTTDYSGAPIGSYAITVSGGTAANYDITHVNGTITVAPGALPTTIINPTIIVQTGSGNPVGAPTLTNSNTNSTIQNDPAAVLDNTNNQLPLIIWDNTPTNRALNNDPLVTFSPELKELLGMDI